MVDDADKSPEQLIEELEALRSRVAALERFGGRVSPAAGRPIPTCDVDGSTAQALLRSSPAAIIVLDVQGRVILWSAAAEALFGWKEHEVLGQVNPIVPEEGREAFAQMLQREIEGVSTINFPCKRRCQDGTLVDVRLSTAPLRDDDGRTLGVVGVLTPADEHPPPIHLAQDAELGGLFDHLYEGVWILDPQGVTTYVNRRMAEMIGYPPEQVIGRSALEFVGEDQREHAADILRRRAEGIAEAHEFWLPHKDGGGIWGAVSGAPMYDRQGDYVGIVATVKDITERKRAEQDLEQRVAARTAELTEANRRLREQIAAREEAEHALRESESRFRLLAENATDLICRHAPDGRYLYVSPSSHKLLGYEPEEMLGRSPYDFFHPEDRERIRTTHDHVLHWPEAATVEFRFRRRDGTYVWLDTVSKAIRDPDTAEIVEIHTASRDATARREAEEQLRLINSAVEQIDEMVVITDGRIDGPGPRIEYVNPAFSRVTGYSFEEIVGKTPRVLQGPRTSRKVLDRLRRCLEAGENFEGETWNYRKDGSAFLLRWHVAPLRDAHGRITHFVSVQRDVTEQRRSEDIARQRQNELAHVGRLSTMGEMASGLAHELNQPLAAIVIYVQGCIRRVQDAGMERDELLEALECVKSQAHRASEIIRRLRDFVRKRQPQRTAADLNHLVNEVLGLLDPEIQRHAVQVRFEPDERLPAVLVDAVQIEQVILNLVRNAVEAMEVNPSDDRVLTIQTGRVDDHRARITVCDAGVGMSDEQLDHIFEPFYTTKSSGMGMGLNISHSIAQANDGRLWAERNSDRGMSFHLSVPFAP